MSGGTHHQPSVEFHSSHIGKPVSDFTIEDWFEVGRLTERFSDYPPFLLFLSQRMRKPVSAFTKDDWRRVAIAGGWLIEELTKDAYPTTKPSLPKKPGRPRNRNAFPEYLRKKMPKRGSGRPRKELWYEKLPASEINNIVASLMTDATETGKKLPKRFYITTLMRTLTKRTGITEDLLDLESALRDKRPRKRGK